MSIPYYIWKDFSVAELEQLLGTDVSNEKRDVWTLVELDEASQLYFYNKRFAPLNIKINYKDHHGKQNFRVYLASIDDESVNLWWSYETLKKRILPYDAKLKLEEWLKKSNYFINIRGLEHFCCTMFGEPDWKDYG